MMGRDIASICADLGCPEDLYLRLLDDASDPIGKYRHQRSHANRRGIAWRYTLASWWAEWQASGRWADRGPRRGQYVMTRPGDVGPYRPGSTAIRTSSENAQEAVDRRRAGKVGGVPGPINGSTPYFMRDPVLRAVMESEEQELAGSEDIS